MNIQGLVSQPKISGYDHCTNYEICGNIMKYIHYKQVPAHCQAEGDEYPVCSLKRATADSTGPSAEGQGAGIIENEQFADFSRWYSHTVNLPHNLLIDAEQLRQPGL